MSGFDGHHPPPVLAAYLREAFLGGPPALEIHPDDEMLQFSVALLKGDYEQALVSYFDSSRRILRIFDQLLRWRFGSWDGIGRLLDFASGFGRVTRLLVRELPPERVWIAEILPAAVEFQASRFGVHGLLSSPRPESFAPGSPSPGEGFDAVIVTSLFTHLPEDTFAAWLTRLLELVRPGGLLIFSTHDLSLLPPEERPLAGFRFRAVSESVSLDKQEYGSTWVNERFVASLLGPTGLAWHHLPRALCNFQDLYLVAKDEPGRRTDFSTLDLHRDLEGYVDALDVLDCGRLSARGWVIDFSHRNPLTEIRLELDGRTIGTCRGFGQRRDVAAVYQVDPSQAAGWEVVSATPSAAPRSTAMLAVKAISADGGERLLHFSTLEGALLWSAERKIAELSRDLATTHATHQATIGILSQHIKAMEASRFWKLRNRWFAVKGALGMAEPGLGDAWRGP